MTRRLLVIAIFAAAPAVTHAQTAAAPLLVTATVMPSCRVDVPQSAEFANLATMPVTMACAKAMLTPRVERPIASQASAAQDAVVTVNF
jgi:hypothetical protein